MKVTSALSRCLGRLALGGILAVLTMAAAVAPVAPGAPVTPAPVKPGSNVKRSQAAPARQGVAVQTKFDYSGIGGAVYATGFGEVVATVYPVKDFLADDFYPYLTIVSQRVGEREVLLGSNRERRTVRLGKLDRGEIRLIARCPDGGDPVFESGSGNRNPDGQPHSRVRTLEPGVVEVYFENTMEEGKRNDVREQHWYKDYKVVFTGAVTADPGVLSLIEKTQDSDPGTREAARQALKALSPAMARQAGIR